jgi:hypothetical protein
MVILISYVVNLEEFKKYIVNLKDKFVCFFIHLFLIASNYK